MATLQHTIFLTLQRFTKDFRGFSCWAAATVPIAKLWGRHSPCQPIPVYVKKKVSPLRVNREKVGKLKRLTTNVMQS